MSDYRIANRYAKSLFELAQEENSVEAIYNDLQTVIKVATHSKDLADLLRSPVIPADKKLKVLETTFNGVHDRTVAFFRLLAEKRREAQLVIICEEFIRRYEDSKGIARAKVTSAIPLSEDILEKVRKYLKGAVQKEDIQLVNIVDEKTIGGMVIEYDNKLLDLSVARELNEIKKKLIYN